MVLKTEKKEVFLKVIFSDFVIDTTRAEGGESGKNNSGSTRLQGLTLGVDDCF